jgi:hypothetical protein
MSRAFTNDVPDDKNYLYKETIAINELLFDGASPIPRRGLDSPSSGRVAGTVYPSVRMRGLADNVVIWPEFADYSLEMRSVRFVLVEAADEDKLSYRFLTVAFSNTSSGNNIIWEQELSPESERRTHVAFQRGRWIFKDSAGRIYDVHDTLPEWHG